MKYIVFLKQLCTAYYIYIYIYTYDMTMLHLKSKTPYNKYISPLQCLFTDRILVK